MREIKFRGRRLDNGEWAYGCLVKIHTSNGYGFGIKDTTYHVNDGYINLIPEEIDTATIGQYTGLHDRNGKEIYEGDILVLWRSVGKDGQLRGAYYRALPVEYSNEWCQFVVVDKANKEQFGIWQQFQVFEVIGNIYQNPELAHEST